MSRGRFACANARTSSRNARSAALGLRSIDHSWKAWFRVWPMIQDSGILSGLPSRSPMRALVCKAHGLPETLVVDELPSPVPGPNQVLVRIEAAGVNFPDALIIQNKYPLKPPLPVIPGARYG